MLEESANNNDFHHYQSILSACYRVPAAVSWTNFEKSMHKSNPSETCHKEYEVHDTGILKINRQGMHSLKT